MKLSDFYFGIANLFLAIEVSFTFEYGWIFGLGLLFALSTYHAFKEGAE